MKLIIYESSSFGGCYDYAKQVDMACRQIENIDELAVLLPKNAKPHGDSAKLMLCNDRPATKVAWRLRLAFVWRTVANPFILWLYLLRSKPSWVLFNDFEQLTAMLWIPFFALLRRKHSFGVLLHDPDRDAYPPAYWFSALSMRAMMSVMQLGFYHESLPQKWYYAGSACNYVPVPHGIYPADKPDDEMLNKLAKFANGRYIFALLGNIRYEKNPEMIVEAMADLPNAVLLIAGKAANSMFDVQALVKLIANSGYADRICWVNRFLTDAELSACMLACDALLLYYKASFSSQSALLNLVANYQKDMIVSRTDSALSLSVQQYNLAELVEADNVNELMLAMRKIADNKADKSANWAAYKQYASWSNNAKVISNAFGGL